MASNIGLGAVGFLAGLTQAIERINERNRQEKLQLLQLGQASGRYQIAPVEPGQLQGAGVFQRLAGGSPYQSIGGQPVVPLGSGGAVTLQKLPTLGELPAQQLEALGFGANIDDATRNILAHIPFTAQTAQEFSRAALATRKEEATAKRVELSDRRKQRRALQAELAKITPETPEQQQRVMAARVLLGSVDESDVEAFERAMALAQDAATPTLVSVATPEGTFLQTPKDARKIRAEEAKEQQSQARLQLAEAREQRATTIAEGNLRVAQANLAIRREEARRPNTVDLAVRAAKGDKDAAAALAILKPSEGLSIETDDQGRITKVTTGGAGKLPASAISGAVEATTAAKNTIGILGDLRKIIEQNPDAVSTRGKVSLELANLGANIATFAKPQDEKTKKDLERLKNPTTSDVSSAEFLGQLLIYQLALINSQDGRVSDADYAASARALGINKTLASAQDILPRLEQFEKITRAKFEDAALILKQKNLPVPDLPQRTGPIVDQALEDLRKLGLIPAAPAAQ